jgi:hypothetical protein
MYDHIDKGKRFSHHDIIDKMVIYTRSDHSLVYTGISFDDFKCVNRNPKFSFKKKYAALFRKWPNKEFEEVFFNPITVTCAATYQGKFMQLSFIGVH